MRLVSSAQMREIDRVTIEGGLVPADVLMARAGEGVFRLLMDWERWGGSVAGRRVLVACGKGNNGGDGFVVARHLMQAGAKVSVFVLAGDLNLSSAAKQALHQLIPLHPDLRKFSDAGAMDAFRTELARCELVVDALFGTGLNAPLRDSAVDVVRALNGSGAPIVSIDVPSGLSGDLDQPAGDCVRATVTATIGLPKIGLYYYPGRASAGDVRVVDIGFPASVIEAQGGCRRLVDRAAAARVLPARDPRSHKYRRGSVLLVAGSRHYAGAALLAAGGALRGGAGMVYVAVPASLAPLVQTRWPSAITLSLPEDEEGRLDGRALAPLQEAAARVQAVALGPGLDRAPATQAMLRDWLERLDRPAVVDADALAPFAGDYARLGEQPAMRVLTPHSGELAMLLGTSAAELDAHREEQLLGARHDRVVLLHKGAPTEIAEPSGLLYTVAGGHPAMARGGTGDVLTGLLGAVLAQDPERPGEMARLAAWLHAEAGRLAAAEWGRGLSSEDLIAALGPAWRELAAAATGPSPR